MKQLIVIALTLAFIVFLSNETNAQSQNNPSLLFGTWQLLSGVTTTKDSVKRVDTSTITQIKVVTPQRFMFFIMKKSNDSIIGAATGRVLFDGKMYTEIIQQTSFKDIKGKIYSYPFRMDGDKWRLIGNIGQRKLDEVWMKLE
jgi:hypothetical protein